MAQLLCLRVPLVVPLKAAHSVLKRLDSDRQYRDVAVGRPI
jgi:hypothetical protein